MKNKAVVLIGYSGHAYVAYEIFEANAVKVMGYCELKQKKQNPYNLEYLGNEKEEQVLQTIKEVNYFVAIGENKIRKETSQNLMRKLGMPVNAIHPTASVSFSVTMGNGVMLAPHVIVNAQTKIGDGVILNSGAIVEHECIVGNFCHIAPGAVLCGNVSVGECTFIGANTVVKQGICIGKNVVLGAGSVIIKDVPDNAKVVGNPQRII